MTIAKEDQIILSEGVRFDGDAADETCRDVTDDPSPWGDIELQENTGAPDAIFYDDDKIQRARREILYRRKTAYFLTFMLCCMLITLGLAIAAFSKVNRNNDNVQIVSESTNNPANQGDATEPLGTTVTDTPSLWGITKAPSASFTGLPTESPTESQSSIPATPSPTETTEAPSETTSQAPLVMFPDSLSNQTKVSLQNPDSPQAKALKWLELHPAFPVMDNWRKEQLFALAAFYYSYDGDNWNKSNRKDWLSYVEPECEWGVSGQFSNQCNNGGRITKLSLDGQPEKIQGTTPPELTLLSSMETFQLRTMHLWSTFEEIVPSTLTSLPSLSTVWLSFDDLRGTLPSYIGDFQQLTNLNLRSNHIAGPLINDISRLTNLRYLTLYDNRFTGTIPQSLSSLSKLESLVLHDTDLTGSFPASVCSIPMLVNIKVDCTKIACPPPCECICIEPKEDDDNYSDAEPTASPTLHSTEPFSLPITDITSEPNELEESDNQAEPTPSPAMEETLEPTTDITSQQYVLDLPESSILALRDPLSPQSAAYVWLLEHPMLDALPMWRRQQLFAMVTFYYTFNGNGWDNRERQFWLDYEAEECQWGDAQETSECDFSGRIKTLSIEHTNGFRGTAMPAEIGLLTSLETLRLRDMDWEANISDLIPGSLTDVPLRELFLMSNNLYGSLVGSKLSSISKVINLNARSNQLTGPIPSEIAQLSDLQFLTLYDNLLTGNVPSELGRLTLLESIFMDRNDLTGEIPLEVCNLPMLRELQVDCDKVTCPADCAACTCYMAT